jgi:hypothetical protein
MEAIFKRESILEFSQTFFSNKNCREFIIQEKEKKMAILVSIVVKKSILRSRSIVLENVQNTNIMKVPQRKLYFIS